jgi:phenylpyruvate tautomerase PptA (4-oxalocrotonate tautomerase family)
MPVFQVYHPEGVLDGPRKPLLARKLTDVLLTMEGGARTAGGVAFASVLFTAVPQEDWWVGGSIDATHVSPPGKFLVRATIPEGYMSQAHKTEVHVAVTRAILEVTGNPQDTQQGGSIQVIIEEVGEGNWGAGGRTISLTSIATSVGLSRTGERFRWVQEFFAAKARQYAAFGYPTDTGGLLPGGK